MSHALALLAELVDQDAAGLFVIGLAAITVLHTAVSLGRSRQWYLLPVVFGLTALAGFLLNPLADSNSLLDLKARLASYETLTFLCIVQFLLVGLSAWQGLCIDGGRNVELSSIWLGTLSSVPAPVLAIAMLLVEQVALATSVDSRPEAVGRDVGLGVAAIVTAAGGIAMCLPSRWLAVPHGVLSVAMILACMLVPFLQDPLPQSMTLVDWESLRLFACLAPVLILIVIAGGWLAVPRGREA